MSYDIGMDRAHGSNQGPRDLLVDTTEALARLASGVSRVRDEMTLASTVDPFVAETNRRQWVEELNGMLATYFPAAVESRVEGDRSTPAERAREAIEEMAEFVDDPDYCDVCGGPCEWHGGGRRSEGTDAG